MNIYDKAHDLANELKNSEEFKEYKESYEKVMADESKKERIMSYRQKLLDFQIKNMGKDELDEEGLKKIEELQRTLFMDTEIASFMQKEANFARIFADISKILEDAVIIEDAKN